MSIIRYIYGNDENLKMTEIKPYLKILNLKLNWK